MPKRPKFRFPTMEEFSKLSRTDKIAYLAAAVEEIRPQKGDAPEHILFIERRAKPHKPPTERK
jgi:hypothetical protein